VQFEKDKIAAQGSKADPLDAMTVEKAERYRWIDGLMDR
jgi:hypothetical protein|tara:strand:- start:422 stop:538 length:117 start_codon:yes stop_codon:yes gene_type:complete